MQKVLQRGKEEREEEEEALSYWSNLLKYTGLSGGCKRGECDF